MRSGEGRSVHVTDGPSDVGGCGEGDATDGPCCGGLADDTGDCTVDGVCNIDLAGLDVEDRLQALAALTARFSASYLRSIGGRGDFLSYPRMRVLDVLRTGGPVIMRDLADALGLTARNITAIVDALEHAGLVVRRAHPTDRRATVIEVTSRGQAVTVEARTLSLSKVAAAFDTLPLDDQQRYAELISRLSVALCDR